MQSDPRISEVLASIPTACWCWSARRDTKLHEVCWRVPPTSWAPVDDPAKAPSLETVDAAAAGVTPLAKTRSRLGRQSRVTTSWRAWPLSDGSLFTINDDDFGIAGEKTRVVILRGDDPQTAGR
jgi:hypothetical protein